MTAVINAILVGAIGAILGHCGLTWATWQYWVIIACVLGVIINMGLGD